MQTTVTDGVGRTHLVSLPLVSHVLLRGPEHVLVFIQEGGVLALAGAEAERFLGVFLYYNGRP
jgi:hypothetical protein